MREDDGYKKLKVIFLPPGLIALVKGYKEYGLKQVEDQQIEKPCKQLGFKKRTRGLHGENPGVSVPHLLHIAHSTGGGGQDQRSHDGVHQEQVYLQHGCCAIKLG